MRGKHRPPKPDTRPKNTNRPMPAGSQTTNGSIAHQVRKAFEQIRHTRKGGHR